MRGSEQGFDADTFARHTRGKGAALLIFRTTKQRVFGAYSPMPLQAEEYGYKAGRG